MPELTRRTLLAFIAVPPFVEQTFAEGEGASPELQALIGAHEAAMTRSTGFFIEQAAAATTARGQAGLKRKRCWPSAPILRSVEATAEPRPSTC